MFVGIEGLTPAFHDELVAPGGVRARRRALAGRRSRRVPPRDRRRCGATPRRGTPSAQRATQATLAYPPRRALRRRRASLAPRSRAPRRVELPTLEVARATTRRDASCASSVDDLRVLRAASSSTRARSATPSTSRRCSTALKQWQRARPARRDRVRLAEPHRSAARRARRARRRGPARGAAASARRERRRHDRDRRAGALASRRASDGVALVTAADIFGAAHAPRAARSEEAREGRAARRRRRLLRSSPPATTSSTSATASAATTASRRSRSARLDPQTTAVGAPTPKPSRSTRSSSSTTAARSTCRSTGSARSSATSAPRATRRRLDKLGGVTWESDAQQGRAPRPRARRGAAPALRAARGAARPRVPARRRRRSASSRRRSRSTRRPIRPTAIDAVLGDMEAPRAMDRLVCGDVGYGKTEVALRAMLPRGAGRQAGGACSRRPRCSSSSTSAR